MPRPRPTLALALALALGCAGVSDDDDSASPLGEAAFDPAPVVLFVLVDTLAWEYLGVTHPEWAITPRLDALFAEATLLERVLTTRGLTSVAVASLLTGTYPRTHGVRNNASWKTPPMPSLIERFDDAGYTTLGYAANTCQFIDLGVDERMCTSVVERPDLKSHGLRDELLVAALRDRLADGVADEPLFVWLHLMNPHKPFTLVQPWFDTFHPEPYDGPLDAEDPDSLDAVTLGDGVLSEADLRYVRAVYASQIRETDRLLGELLDTLDGAGLLEEAVVVFGADHGEELGGHHAFFWHSCSPYLTVQRVVFAIRAPGRLPAGGRPDGWASVIDVAPTVAHVAGLPPLEGAEGISLVADIERDVLPARALFHERGPDAAGVLFDGLHYLRDEERGYGDCRPYNTAAQAFPNELDELYRVDDDPGEVDDLVASAPGDAERLRTELCRWVTGRTWSTSATTDDHNDLVVACRALLDGDVAPSPPAGGCATAGAATPAVGAAALVLGGLRGWRGRRRRAQPIIDIHSPIDPI